MCGCACGRLTTRTQVTTVSVSREKQWESHTGGLFPLLLSLFSFVSTFIVSDKLVLI